MNGGLSVVSASLSCPSRITDSPAGFGLAVRRLGLTFLTGAAQAPSTADRSSVTRRGTSSGAASVCGSIRRLTTFTLSSGLSRMSWGSLFLCTLVSTGSEGPLFPYKKERPTFKARTVCRATRSFVTAVCAWPPIEGFPLTGYALRL